MRAPAATALAGLTAVLASAACDSGPPVRSASGEIVESVTFEERFALTNDAASEVRFGGERLRKAMPLLEKTGVSALSGSFSAGHVLDKSTMTITFEGAQKKTRTVTVKNCAEPHVCAFFEQARKEGFVDKLPAVCRGTTACGT
ncbi:MAG: hypothetical protein JWP97_3817 [Labilithrix sp.]|nr:hypothetical protein [Labilithrix sp.]